jgi:sterol desaturase/sphingolipid hydroxylase (fatty acid hydroxylase superfamily)
MFHSSYHHRLYVPYAFGALYNHPVEGFVMDSVGATLAFTLSGLPTKGAIFFFAFSTLKTGMYLGTCHLAVVHQFSLTIFYFIS